MKNFLKVASIVIELLAVLFILYILADAIIWTIQDPSYGGIFFIIVLLTVLVQKAIIFLQERRMKQLIDELNNIK